MKKHMKRGKVIPMDQQFENRSYSTDEKRKQSEIRWQNVLTAVNVTTKWKDFDAKKRPGKRMPGALISRDSTEACRNFHDNLNKNIAGIHEQIDEPITEQDEEDIRPHRASERALIIYMAKLGQGSHPEEPLDLDFMESLLENGANINSSDKYGQTMLHEAARAWNPDVARFLIAKGADVNQADKFGRKPLHMAAAVNYPKMVEFLIENGADLESETYGELQTPTHYAARNDALEALKLLLRSGADLEARDYKKRTPLHIASELDRSTTAKYLIEQGAFVGVSDESGLPALSLMIEKMTSVAKEALERLHKTDGPNRKQMFYLNYLEPATTGCDSFARSPMTITVKHEHIDLLVLPSFRKLLQVKWNSFGRKRHVINMILYVLFIALWTAIGLTQPPKNNKTNLYEGYRVWWRLLLDGMSVLFTFYYIILEVYEWRTSVREHAQYREWRIKQLELDLQYTHPRWPQERDYINQEIEAVRSTREPYLSDWWNIFDWLVYLLVVGALITRGLCIASQKQGTQPRVVAVAIIFIWLRSMKLVRVFSALGPFVVMLGHMIDDTMKFGFLFLEFFIPFTLAFYIVFGASTADGWKSVSELIYSVWLIVIVGDYDFNALTAIDPIMAPLMVGIFTACTAIVLLNLFIAQMSNSFQTVYDNAKANALMQQASIVLAIESQRGSKKQRHFQQYLETKCSPLVDYWDDDMEGEDDRFQKITLQIKEVVDGIQESLEGSSKPTSKPSTTDGSISELRVDMERMAREYLRNSKHMNRKIDTLTKLVEKIVHDQSQIPSKIPPIQRKDTRDADDESGDYGLDVSEILPPAPSLPPPAASRPVPRSVTNSLHTLPPIRFVENRPVRDNSQQDVR